MIWGFFRGERRKERGKKGTLPSVFTGEGFVEA